MRVLAQPSPKCGVTGKPAGVTRPPTFLPEVNTDAHHMEAVSEEIYAPVDGAI